MHTSVLTNAQNALTPMLPLSRRPIPVFPVGPAVSGVLPWPVVGEDESLSWRAELARAMGRVPVGGAGS